MGRRLFPPAKALDQTFPSDAARREMTATGLCAASWRGTRALPALPITCERATLGRYAARRLAADGDCRGLSDEQGRPARARPRHLSLHRAHRRNRTPVRAALGGSAAAIVVATAPNARAQPRSAGRTEDAQPNGGTLRRPQAKSGNGRQHRLRRDSAPTSAVPCRDRARLLGAARTQAGSVAGGHLPTTAEPLFKAGRAPSPANVHDLSALGLKSAPASARGSLPRRCRRPW